MSPNRRIALNIAATYGRSLYALACGIFTSRWVLQSLGQVDYGLYGVVGGLAAFISFFNSLLAGTIGRFYAFSVGQDRANGYASDNCMKWFNTAVVIHAIVPIVLTAIGYPLGIWTVRHYLTIPPDRVEACVWVFRCVCITCFVGMASVPFNALYTAKQYIAELTVYSFVTTTLNIVVVCYMVNHPGDWLVRYGMWMCVMQTLPPLIIAARAVMIFPECRLRFEYMLNKGRFLQLLRFSSWQLFGNLGYLVKNQGISILVNKFWGPVYNSSMTIGGTVSSYADQLAGSMNGAFSPAITNFAGENKKEKYLQLTDCSCRLGAVMCLVFAVPLIVEMDNVINLWLKNPPPFVGIVCCMMLLILVLDESTRGIGIAITASGRLAKYYVFLGLLNILSLPLAWSAACLGGCFVSVFMCLLALKAITVSCSVLIAEKEIGVSFKYWLRSTVIPAFIIVLVSGLAGLGLRKILCVSIIIHVPIVLLGTSAIVLLMAWVVMLKREEKELLVCRSVSFVSRIGRFER